MKCEEKSNFNLVKNLFIQCANRTEILKCVKIQALKIVNRAISLRNIRLFDGVSFIRDDNLSRSISYGLRLNDTKLQKLNSKQLDDLLGETSSK